MAASAPHGDDATLGSRLGGLFRSRSSVGAARAPAQEELHQLQAQVQELTAATRNAKEHAQQVELEKKLLENFVNQIMANDSGDGASDDAAAASQARENVAVIITKNAQLTFALEKARQEVEESAGAHHRAEKKAAAFEAALNNVQEELRAADEQLKATRAELATQRNNEATIQRLTDELETKNGTLEALMARVTAISDDKKRAEIEFATILQRTQLAASDASEELEDARARCTALAAELEAAKKERGFAPPAVEGGDTAEGTGNNGAVDGKSEALEELRGEYEAEKARLDAQVRDVQQQLMQAESAAADRHAADAHEMEQLRAAVDAHDAGLHDLRALLQRRDDDRAAMEDAVRNAEAAAAAEAETARIEVGRLETRARAAEERADGLAADLQALEAELCATRAGAARVSELEEQLEALRGAVESREEAIRELTAQVEETEGAARLKARSNANLVKELQQQVLRLQRAASSSSPPSSRGTSPRSPCRVSTQRQQQQQQQQQQQHADPFEGAAARAPEQKEGEEEEEKVTDELLQQENAALVGRVADLQQEMWLLQEAKRSYEDEIVRLNAELAAMREVMTAHYYDAAQRANKERGKLGASFFKPSAGEVVVQMRAALEEAQRDNLAMQAELREVRRSLDHALRVISLAEEEGFVVQDDDLHADSAEDEEYEGTFE